MLRLASSTPASWAGRVVPHLDEVLLDHAHCEKRAASTAIGLVFRYPEHPSLALPLSRLAREELSHFEEVLEVLRRRGVTFRRIQPSPYAERLTAFVRGAEPQRAVDTLLCCALIEARSCERMRVLSESLEDEALARFYRALLAAEARHFDTYVDLARSLRLVPDEELDRRLDAAAAHEAAVLAGVPPMPRLHA